MRRSDTCKNLIDILFFGSASNAIVVGSYPGEGLMAKLRTAALIALFLAMFGTAQADTLKMDGMSAGSNDARPTRGMTQASVESKFGSPVAVKAAVGEPPITRWEYANFVVFFEHDRVIHAVAKR
jgi:hypothetical protein